MFLKSFLKILFPQIWYNFASWPDFICSFVSGNIFYFLKSIIFFPCYLREVQNFFIQSFPQYKTCLLCIWSNTKIVDIECPQGICLSTFVVEEFSGLSVYPASFSY